MPQQVEMSAASSGAPRRRFSAPVGRVLLSLLVALALQVPVAAVTPVPVSEAACESSLQSLINGTPSGGTLNVPACTYRESVTIGRSITIHASGAIVDGENTRTTGVTVTGNNVTIDGLTVERVNSGSHVGAVNLQGGDGFTFSNGVIRDSATVCLGLHGGSGARINGSELAGCGKEGYFLNDMTDTVLSGNHIHGNNPDLAYDWFVEAGGGKTMASKRITFRNNEVDHNRGPGIWFDSGASNVTVTGNHVHDNDRAGIFFEISSGADISGNAVWNNGWGFATWGWGAGITISSSDGASVSGNTVAWNARGISVISQARQLSPHDHDTVTNNVIISAHGDRVAGFYDDHGGTLFDAANANGGSGNRYWVGDPEPTSYRFEWNGGKSTLAAYNNTRGEEGGTYLSTADRDSALGAAGIPGLDGVTPPAPAPRAGDPRVLIPGGSLGKRGVRVKVRWSSIAIANRYQLQVQRDGGSWQTVSLARATSLSRTLTLSSGHRYRVRLRLRTPPATWSKWAVSDTFTPKRYQETTSLASYSGRWRRTTSSGAVGGRVRYATQKGATATFRFTGRAVAWVAPRGSNRGVARVYLDGVYRGKVNLHASSFSPRRIMFRASWSSSGSHTLVIRVVHTAGHPRVDVDAFTVLR